MYILKNHPNLRKLRKELRRNMTQPEQKLWYHVRGARLKGYKFRRQYTILEYILDFYCVQAKLAVEVDGDSHYTPEQQSRDARRTQDLSCLGITVLRFTNADINSNIEGVLEKITAYLL